MGNFSHTKLLKLAKLHGANMNRRNVSIWQVIVRPYRLRVGFAAVIALMFFATLQATAQDASIQNDAAKYETPTPKFGVEISKNIMVPMRDGVRLATDVYKPVDAGDKLPVIVMRTPYNKETYRGAIVPADFFAGQGYVVLVQDTRGKFQSEGTYSVQMADTEDGYDTIDWAAKQLWSTGNIGTYGCSYLGEVQYLLAKMQHPNHLAMIPQAASGAVGPAGGYYKNFGAYEGGAFTLSSVLGWFAVAGSKIKPADPTKGLDYTPDAIDFPAILRSLPTVDMAKRAGVTSTDFEDFVMHPPADPYWDQMHYLRDDDQFNTPALHVNSWLDLTPDATLYTFNLMRQNAQTPRAGDNQFVIISPTVHCASEGVTAHAKVGDLDVGDARLPYWRIYLDWFDYWLKGVDNDITQMPKVQYYVTGKNEWRSASAWPLPEMRFVPYYLSSIEGAVTGAGDGSLSTIKSVRNGSDRFAYDPEDPFPSRGGNICCTGDPNELPGVFDQSDLEVRPDLLVYSTPVLNEGITVAGPVKIVLYVSSSARDTDFTAKLIDVDEEGRAWNVVNGILRARYREGMDKTVWMQPDSVYRLEVNLKETAYHFAAGHSIRLYISSSDFPMYDRNLNTGGDNVTETTWVKAANTIHFSQKHASHLMLPVVN